SRCVRGPCVPCSCERCRSRPLRAIRTIRPDASLHVHHCRWRWSSPPSHSSQATSLIDRSVTVFTTPSASLTFLWLTATPLPGRKLDSSSSPRLADASTDYRTDRAGDFGLLLTEKRSLDFPTNGGHPWKGVHSAWELHPCPERDAPTPPSSTPFGRD